MNRRDFLKNGISVLAMSRATKAVGGESMQLQAAGLVGGAKKVADRDSSAGYLASLTEPGHGVRFTGLPAGCKLSIR